MGDVPLLYIICKHLKKFRFRTLGILLVVVPMSLVSDILLSIVSGVTCIHSILVSFPSFLLKNGNANVVVQSAWLEELFIA